MDLTMKWYNFLWELPQHLLGLLLIPLLKARKIKFAVADYWMFEPDIVLAGTPVYRLAKFLSGGSFGKYIILPDRACNEAAVRHEYGHSLQSRAWGPLYLLVIGLPSAFNNLWDRLFHKKWPAGKRLKWYYGRWPEKQADRLGGIVWRDGYRVLT